MFQATLFFAALGAGRVIHFLVDGILREKVISDHCGKLSFT